MRPDYVYLWIAEGDVTSLPEDVRRLESHGLVIRACADFRSYTKIIPALASDAKSFLVTADDDQYYPRNWLQDLVSAYRTGTKEILCARAHRIRLDNAGRPLSYLKWDIDVPAGDAELLLFPTGVGGVLYEPGIFHVDVARSDLFTKLCPTADDVWLYWMAALNGALFRKIGRRRRQIIWAGSQSVSLFSVNLAANDEQITNMIARYGFPADAEAKRSSTFM